MLYGRLAYGSARQGNHMTYMNSLRKTLKACELYDVNLEYAASDRNSWRRAINKGVQKSEEDYLIGLREKYLHSSEKRHAPRCQP